MFQSYSTVNKQGQTAHKAAKVRHSNTEKETKRPKDRKNTGEGQKNTQKLNKKQLFANKDFPLMPTFSMQNPKYDRSSNKKDDI